VSRVFSGTLADFVDLPFFEILGPFSPLSITKKLEEV
jgi:hypothetical protein